MDRACSIRPATAPVSAATIHPGPPASVVASSDTSSLVADRTPRHYTAALLYTVANTAGETPVAGTETKHGILATAL